MKKRAVEQPAKKPATPNLEEFPPYLFHLISSGLNGRLLERLRPYGVTVQRWRVLMVVMNKGPRSLSELTELTLIPQSGLSRVIDQMERDELVVRRLSAEDNRVVKLELTDHGRRLYWQILPAATEHARTVMAGLDKSQRKQLNDLLHHVLRNLQVFVSKGEYHLKEGSIDDEG
ncbi:MAG TPA: MarR family transcriptional regulator [Steroidobacteraceae bacterium]|nr:MarR family transcriptional regulator [Steroidobacteraceae bacterium]